MKFEFKALPYIWEQDLKMPYGKDDRNKKKHHTIIKPFMLKVFSWLCCISMASYL